MDDMELTLTEEERKALVACWTHPIDVVEVPGGKVDNQERCYSIAQLFLGGVESILMTCCENEAYRLALVRIAVMVEPAQQLDAKQFARPQFSRLEYPVGTDWSSFLTGENQLASLRVRESIRNTHGEVVGVAYVDQGVLITSKDGSRLLFYSDEPELFDVSFTQDPDHIDALIAEGELVPIT